MNLEENIIYTCGELLGDGTAIDLICDRQLVLWGSGAATILPAVHYAGATYRAMPLDHNFERMLGLPAEIGECGSVESLASDLSTAVRSYAGLDEQPALLTAAFVMSSWVGDCLPHRLCLNMWGPIGTEISLMDSLFALLRRPLRLSQPRMRELVQLPGELCPAVVLVQPPESALIRFLAETGDRRSCALVHGRPVRVDCSTVAYTTYRSSATAISIRLLPSRTNYRRVSVVDSQRLSTEFRPRLLHYRLSQHAQVLQSTADWPDFAPETRLLARCLGAALEGASNAQLQMVEALRAQDEEHKAQQGQRLEAVVVEALLAECHENKASATIADVAELANAVLFGRHDDRELSPKAVGAIVREQLGLTTKRTASGYIVSLNDQVKQKVHDLIAMLALPTLMPNRSCSWCNRLQNAAEISSLSSQVHQL